MDLAARDDRTRRATERATQRVGAITLLLFAGLGVAQVALDDCHLGDDIHVTVYFEHLGGLAEGSEFQVAGRVLGEIESISLVPAHRTGPGHPLHATGGGGVAVRVRIDDEYRSMTAKNGEVFISNKGVFGEKYLEMGVPPGGAVPAEPLADGDELRGVDPPHLDRVLLRSYRNIQLMRTFMEEIRPEWDELAAALDQLAQTLATFDLLPAAQLVGISLGEVVDRAGALQDTLDAAGATQADILALIQRARAIGARMDSDLATLSVRIDVLVAEVERIRGSVPAGTIARLEAALTTARGSVARLRGIADKARGISDMIRRGEGTVGALWNDPEFPEHAKSLGRLIKKHPWRLLGHESVD